jgi:hypothetical protein
MAQNFHPLAIVPSKQTWSDSVDPIRPKVVKRLSEGRLLS